MTYKWPVLMIYVLAYSKSERTSRMTVEELMKSWGTFLTLYTKNSVFRHNMELLSRISLEQFGQDIACDAVKNTADLYDRGELGGGGLAS